MTGKMDARRTRPAAATLAAAVAVLLGLAVWCGGRRAFGAVYTVGGAGTYAKLRDLPPLAPGDVVEIAPGTYRECVRWTASGTAEKPITIRGSGTATSEMPVIDGTGLVVSGAGAVPRALFQIEGDHYRIEHLRFTNAANGENGAGIRVTGHARDTRVTDCRIDHNEMGVMSDGNDDLTLEFCDIGDNGNPAHFAGYAHNLYLAGRTTTIQFCRIHDAHAGMNVKSRGHFIALLYNEIADSDEGEVSLVESGETAVPDSNAVLIGNRIVSKAHRSGNNHKFIDFGQESGRRIGTLTLINNTLIAGDEHIVFVHLFSPDARLVAWNNRFEGSSQIVANADDRVTGAGNVAPVDAGLPAGFVRQPSAANAASPPDLQYRDGDGRLRDGTPRFEFTPGARRREDVIMRHDAKAPIPGAFAGKPPV